MNPIRYSLRSQLLLLFLLIGLVPLILVGWFSVHQAKYVLMRESFAKLSAVQKIHKLKVEEYFHDIILDIETLAKSPSVLHVFMESDQIFHSFEKNGGKMGGADWMAAVDNDHSRWLEDYQKTLGYYDLILIDAEYGNLVFSILHESAIGENVTHGSLKSTGLATLFKKAQSGVAIQDFEPYPPSNDLYSFFVGAPLKKEGKTLGVVVLQFLSIEYNAWLSERSGMGETGESYLIGQHDGITSYRSVRNVKESQIGQQRTGPYIEEALAGKSGQDHKMGSTGKHELVRYAPLQVPGLHWAIFSTIAQDEVQKPARNLTVVVVMVVVVMVFLLIGLAFHISREFIHPLNVLVKASKDLVSGAYETRVPEFRQIELKSLTDTFNQMAFDIGMKTKGLEYARGYVEKIFSSMAAGLFVTSEGGVVKTANRAACDMLGYTDAAELIHQPIGAFFDEAFLPKNASLNNLNDFFNNFEAKAFTKSGTQIDVLLSKSNLGEQMDFAGAVFVFRDISESKAMKTEIKLTYDKLKESEASLRVILDHAMDAIIATDCRGMVTVFNPAAEALFGYTQKELLGKDVSDFIVPNESREAHQSGMARYCRLGEERGEDQPVLNRRVELVGRKKNGQPVDLEIALTSMFFEGEMYFAAFLHDITGRKVLLHSLQDALKAAEQSAKFKSEFLANMSHEIRTPMNAIIGLTHLSLQTKLTLQQRDYLDKIHASANALLRIINDILDFSKIEAGKLAVEIISFRLSDVLNDLATLTTMKTQGKDLEVVFIVAQDVPQTLLGDPTRVGQILINLTSNAAKFTPSGEIVLFIERVDGGEGYVTLQFSVRDTGIGMTQDQMDRLFQAFSQADGGTTRKYGGTGLGLTISKRLVGLMGGTIWVESVEGQGSTFFFTTRFGLSEKAEESSFQLPKELQKKRVLVVDDNETSQKMLRAVLESFFFQVTHTSSGMAGLLELEKKRQDEEPFDLLLLDWRMPGLDGIQTFHCMKSLENPFDLPTLFMVPHTEQADVRDSFGDIQPEAYLDKPIQPSALFDAIMTLLGKGGGLPMVEDKESILSLQPSQAIAGARVLLVEDNEINQQVGKELLEMAGIVVEIVANGQQAVLRVAETAFELVLMDIQMPVMDGYQATREIRKNSDRAKLPIVAMTANVMVQDLARCWDAGMDGHIPKPIDPKKLFRTLNKWIKPRERPLSRQDGFVDQELTNQGQKVRVDPSFPVLSGMNTEFGLSRVGGNVTLFRTLLSKFVENHANCVAEIQTAVANEEMQHARRVAHTLKGVAGTMGALRLQAMARTLESTLIVTPDFVAELALVIDAIKQFQSDSPGERQTQKSQRLTVEPSDLLETLKQLKPHVEKKRPKNCRPILEELEQMTFPVTVESDMVNLVKLIKKYKMKEAQSLLDTIMARLTRS